MKIYNETWLRNRAIQEQSEYWQKKGVLSAEQLATIQTQFPDLFYRPNIWIKVGLFFFTCIAASFALGLTSVFTLAIFDDVLGSGFVSILYGLSFYFILNFFIKNRKLYHSGIDNALLYIAVGWFLTGFFLMFSKGIGDNIFLLSFITLMVFSFAVIRYADWLLTIGAFCCFCFLVNYEAFQIPLGKLLLPFVNMGLAALIYFVKKRIFEEDKFFYWADCLMIIEVLALVLFYLGGNYGVVREGNAAINDTTGQIAFAPLFYAFTALVPFIYLFFGVKRKDRILIILGLLTFVLSVSTFKYYFSIAPPEISLTIAGAFLIAVAWACIRYLRPPKYGFTYEQDKDLKGFDAEAAIIAQTLGKTAQPEPGFQFGGGDFGGGGAGEKY